MAYYSRIQWAPIMLIVSLVAFFFAVSILGFEGFNVIARQNQGRLIAFFTLLSLALAFSWGAFISSIRQFRFYDDRRWAWLYCIFSDLVATLITVAALYSVFAIVSIIT
jgi:hypothetical protein